MTTGLLRRPRQPLSARWLLRESLTARGAASIIATITLVLTLAGGVAARLADPKDFHTLGAALWWSLQTVTTVGYGDITPSHTSGRLIGAAVMLGGLGFLAVITASVTAALVEHARRRLVQPENELLEAGLRAIDARLQAIESALQQPHDGSGSDRDVL
jgi:voltage-gated potassium channel Kch